MINRKKAVQRAGYTALDVLLLTFKQVYLYFIILKANCLVRFL